jgi:hypothetical protein
MLFGENIAEIAKKNADNLVTVYILKNFVKL